MPCVRRNDDDSAVAGETGAARRSASAKGSAAAARVTEDGACAESSLGIKQEWWSVDEVVNQMVDRTSWFL